MEISSFIFAWKCNVGHLVFGCFCYEEKKLDDINILFFFQLIHLSNQIHSEYHIENKLEDYSSQSQIGISTSISNVAIPQSLSCLLLKDGFFCLCR